MYFPKLNNLPKNKVNDGKYKLRTYFVCKSFITYIQDNGNKIKRKIKIASADCNDIIINHLVILIVFFSLYVLNF